MSTSIYCALFLVALSSLQHAAALKSLSRTLETKQQLNIDIINSSGPVNADVVQLQASNRSSISFVGAIRQEIEFEVSAGREVVKNKLVLAILEVLGLGACGIDRCYMGQPCLGITKGVTLGGLFVWAMIDYFAVVITCLSFSDYINAVGMRARFAPEGCTTAAFWVALVALVFKCCSGGLGGARARMLALSKDMPEADIKTVFDELDTDKDGKLVKREIETALKKLNISEGDAVELLAKADNSEGGLDFGEFGKFVRGLPGPS